MQTMKIGTATVPVLGMGTWHMGEMSPTRTQMEVQSLRYGLDHGLRVIDTAAITNGLYKSILTRLSNRINKMHRIFTE